MRSPRISPLWYAALWIGATTYAAVSLADVLARAFGSF